jgi:hypothetical protein
MTGSARQQASRRSGDQVDKTALPGEQQAPARPRAPEPLLPRAARREAAAARTRARHGRAVVDTPATPGARLEDVLLPGLLVGLTIYFGFDAGGYLTRTHAWVAAVLLVALGLRVLVAGRPPRGLTRPLALAASALALLAVWALASGVWSDAPYRGLLEFTRLLLYFAVLLLFASARRPQRTLSLLPPAMVVAATVVCGAAVAVRAAPDAWPLALPEAGPRMDWPLSYENALGVFASLGIVFALHTAVWARWAVAVRAASAATLPLLGAALVLTLSRGGTLAAAVGVLVYLALGRARGLQVALIALTVIAGVLAYSADGLTGADPRSASAIDQGHALLVAVAVIAAAAAVVVLAGAGISRVVSRAVVWRPSRRVRRLAVVTAAGAAVAAAGVAIATGGAADLYDRADGSAGTGERGRLSDVGAFTNAQSRPKYWNVSLDAFERSPLRGSGAQTFGVDWARERPIDEASAEGHSVYVETLGELGLVGAVLLVVLLGTVVVAAAARVRGPARPLYAAVVAASALWLLHAALDWDWEMPALTVWLFAMGGCVLAASGRRRGASRVPGWTARTGIAAVCALAVVTPYTVARSQAQLDDAAAALERGDCAGAQRRAFDAIETLDLRPEGYAFVGYCQARAGRPAAAAWLDEAITRDPDSWSLHYGSALTRAAIGQDPRPAARRALALAPREFLAIRADERLATGDRRAWRDAVRTLPLPLVQELRTAKPTP